MSKAAQAPVNTFDADCRKFIQLHAKVARMTARMEKIKERIKPDLANGASSPKDLPYVLVLKNKVRTLYKWEESLRDVLHVWLGNPEREKEQLERIKGSFEMRTDTALLVEINKAYAAKL